MSSFIGGMPTTTVPTYDYTWPPSTNASSQSLSEPAPPPSYTALPQASEVEKQRAKEAISSPSHLPSVSYAELLKQWCFFCSFAHVFSICAGHSRSEVQLGAQFTYLAWNKFGNGRFQRPIPPPHIHINQKKLFGTLSPIGSIPRYLSCLSSFSSQPSPFPLPFHSHWFSSLNAEAERLL